MVRLIRIFILFLILISSIFWFNLTAFANGPASAYKVTLTRLELYNGTEWITAFSGTSSEIDIAAVSGTGFAGSFLSGLIVPDGTYTQIRVTPSGTFKISGNDGSNYTTATVGPGGGSTPTANSALQAECTITITVSAAAENISATPIVIKDGIPNKKVRVNFNVSSAIQTILGELFPAAPSVTITLQ